MAHFQKTAGDKNTRLDTVDKTLVLMLDERVKVDLWGAVQVGRSWSWTSMTPT